MRAFIAVELNKTVKEALSALIGRLRQSGARVSWVKPEAMHLTLRFLGEIDSEAVVRLGDIFARDYQGFEPFTLAIRGTGAFPNMRQPTVAWAGVTPIEGSLTHLQELAERAAQAIGLAPEKRRFHPHLTLARIKEPSQAAGLASLLARERDFDAGCVDVQGVSLFSSRLTPQGALHTREREFTF